MAVEVGQIVQGRVVRLLAYGVLVRLDDGTTGLVHISEIDQNYVRDVADYFALDDMVNVKVLKAEDRGKIELSVKQARVEGEPIVKARAPQSEDNGDAPQRSEGRDGGGYRGGGGYGGGDGSGAPRRESRASFEEKMGEFMRSSSERLSDLKRNIEGKRGGKKTR
jgi:S1 RNA binding domain protein